MKWSELKRKAIAQGWIFDSHGGRHDAYTKKGEKITIPRHDSQEVPTGLYFELKKRIGF
jgi:predicted RNA binding protein YcfA (HicA-like mRNA interferase family)